MRNVLVFPDGTEHDFMYPKNREVTVGEQLQILTKDDVIHILTLNRIQKTDQVIYYHLSR